MLLQRLCRPLYRQQQSFLRAAIEPSKRFPQVVNQRRWRHLLPPFRDQTTLEQSGIPGLYTPEGFEIAWTRYQSWLIHKLNIMTEGTLEEHMDTLSLTIWASRDPATASLFNLASMAFNNHFFFRCLTPREELAPVSAQLQRKIQDTFGSVDNLRSEMIGTASSMFGPGFVWLVIHNKDKLRLLTTYNAGSPLPGAHWRQQPRDLNTENASTVGGLAAEQSGFGVGGYGGAMDKYAPRKAPGGADIIPVLCVNTWQHAYLRDFNVDGKDQYLEAWWDRIDWNIVEDNARPLLEKTLMTG